MTTPKSLEFLEQQRVNITNQIAVPARVRPSSPSPVNFCLPVFLSVWVGMEPRFISPSRAVSTPVGR